MATFLLNADDGLWRRVFGVDAFIPALKQAFAAKEEEVRAVGQVGVYAKLVDYPPVARDRAGVVLHCAPDAEISAFIVLAMRLIRSAVEFAEDRLIKEGVVDIVTRSRDYDIVLSFAGEDRAVAEVIAERLLADGYRVFYDKYEQANLVGKDLYAHLSEVYRKKGRFCVMIVSEHYARKLWTNHERKSAQARAFEENQEYILPLRMDDAELPGLLPTVGFLDLRRMAMDEVYNILKKKLDAV
jgi:hypothetical protein